MLRCPHAHATVELDLDAARAMPGVHAVLTPATTCRYDGLRRCSPPSPTTRARRSPRSPPRRPRRPRRRSTRCTRAGRRCSVRGRPRAGPAEQRFAEDPSEDERGDVDAAFEHEADVVIEAEYRTPAQLQQALEPHCAVAGGRRTS